MSRHIAYLIHNILKYFIIKQNLSGRDGSKILAKYVDQSLLKIYLVIKQLQFRANILKMRKFCMGKRAVQRSSSSFE